jgi:hypothetical protein
MDYEEGVSSRVGAAWIRPTSTDPGDLVNRSSDRQRLLDMLTEYIDLQQKNQRLLITGDRGVGKSILTRNVLAEFVNRRPAQVARVLVNGRGAGYRSFLKELARGLAEAIRPLAAVEKRQDVLAWLDELLLVVNNAQITRGQTTTVATKYGLSAAASLFEKLKAHFSWEETRSLAQTQQQVINVSDDFLHAAIAGTLELVGSVPAWVVVIFYDDLDQAFDVGDPRSVDSSIQRILELQPCVAIAHIRTEALTETVRRVIDEQLELKVLPPPELVAILRNRIQKAPAAAREALSGTFFEPFEHLAGIVPTPTPLAFLRWVHAMLRLWEATPPSDWTSPARLREIAMEATPTGGTPSGLIEELARLVDICQIEARGCQWEDLVRGCPSTHPVRSTPALSEQDLNALIERGLLIRRDKALQPTYRLEPTLELLRPSVAKSLSP